MKRSTSSHSHRDEKLKPRNEDETTSRSRTEEEKLRRRREWLWQQEREREHERLKKKMILEYEMRRAREKDLRESKGRSHHSHSSSKSKSPQSRHGRTSMSDTLKTSTLCEKLESSNGTTPIFKGPEGTQISVTELRRIKVDIHRNIPGKSTADDLHRDIVNPEDVVIQRREGEGSKPIFERDEIKNAVSKTEEVGERRTVVAINNENLDNKSKTYKKYTTSPTCVTSRSHSPPRTSPRHFRHEDSKYDNKESYKSDRERHRSRDKSREYRECYTEKDRVHTHPHGVEKDRSRERRSRREHSRSRDREERKWDRDSHHRSVRDERLYQGYRKRSRERSRERRERDRSRELRVPPPHYIEQIPVPIYCGNFPPRPIMVGPLLPIRTPVPFGSVRHPSMMGPLRPFPPRFIPPDMYRMRPPPNPSACNNSVLQGRLTSYFRDYGEWFDGIRGKRGLRHRRPGLRPFESSYCYQQCPSERAIRRFRIRCQQTLFLLVRSGLFCFALLPMQLHF
ncbi:uncharacterized protein LOC100879792 isoform X2 [Megachile rotundata]|uniref:uncharacterized protein LOC100879792 isoform X2 n=1 Tax=Megachile rotundata TaxID=143995 RepID=UPI000614B55B|nr:PREDICTED: zinc finger CCCH domain-containing protein 13-like isoform X2 [Megachile rotundata]